MNELELIEYKKTLENTAIVDPETARGGVRYPQYIYDDIENDEIICYDFDSEKEFTKIAERLDMETNKTKLVIKQIGKGYTAADFRVETESGVMVGGVQKVNFSLGVNSPPKIDLECFGFIDVTAELDTLTYTFGSIDNVEFLTDDQLFELIRNKKLILKKEECSNIKDDKVFPSYTVESTEYVPTPGEKV